MIKYSNTGWTVSDLTNQREKWVYNLTVDDIKEIESAFEIFTESALPLESITTDTFPIPILGIRLTELFNEVNAGLGICSIRGLPVWRYSEKEYLTSYLGIAAYFGNLRPQPQGSHGWLTNHIRDLGVDQGASGKVVLSQTNVALNTHTDSCDIGGLLCLTNAKDGGANYVASSIAISECIKKTNPVSYQALTEFLPYDRNISIQPSEDPWFMMPVFNTEGDHAIYFNLQYALFAQDKFPKSPRMSQSQLKSLQDFQHLSTHPDYAHATEFQSGDIQFINNLICVHYRTGYVDGTQPDEIRHLVRLWLSSPTSRSLPEYYKSRWGSTTPGSRGGVNSADISRKFQVALLQDVLIKRNIL